MSELLCKVLFTDLDDTIWDFRANSVLSLRQVYDEFALTKDLPDYDRFKSLYMATNHELWELYHHNRITKDYLIVERFSRPLRHAGSKMSEDKEFIMALNDRYLDVLSQQKTLVPGAVELLDYLTERGYSLYILSNGFAEVQSRTASRESFARLLIAIPLVSYVLAVLSLWVSLQINSFIFPIAVCISVLWECSDKRIR